MVVRDDAPSGACEAYVAGHPAASAYHRPSWLKVIEHVFGHETTYLAATAGGAIVGVLPLVFFSSRVFGRFTVSMPFLNYGGVLADSTEAQQMLLQEAVAMTRQAGGSHVELRHTQQIFPALPAKHHKVAMTLRLADTPDEQWRRLDRKIRNQVRKAEKHGLTVERGGPDLLDGFYQVFAENMRDLGTPVYNRRFFREVLATFPDSTAVFAVRLAGRPIAASVVCWYRDTIEVPWASSLRAFNPLCANVLLYWNMLRFAIEHRFRTFDFGRSTPGEGTFLFKKQWGAEPRGLVWEYWVAGGRRVPDLSPRNPKLALAVRSWQRLPLKMATALGPYIVRNIP
jgi:FemAB-related protein (PEP-CTERM system-associated)